MNEKKERVKRLTALVLAEKLHVPVRVIEDISDIEEEGKAAMGWFNLLTGEIAVILPNCADAAEVQRTILHEAVAHYGLPELLGREKADELFRKVFDAVQDTPRGRELLVEHGNKTVAGEEYLAELAEGNVTPGILHRIIAAIREFFREVLGIDLQLTDADMQYMLWQSKHNLQQEHTGTVKEITEPGFRYRKTIDHEMNDNSLIAVHNLSEARLKEVFGLGGFPMPSLAITKADIGHVSFGEISLVFGKETIDPTDRRNKVYGEDAWTPTFPEIGFKINKSVADTVRKKIASILGPLYSDLRASVYLYDDNLSEAANRYNGDMSAAMSGDKFMMYAYRKDKGLKNDPDRYDPEYRAWINDLFEGIIEKRGIRNNRDFFTPSGNQRKWESLYDAISLDTVVKAMQSQAAKGGRGLFGANIFGAAQKEYGSVDEIRKAARERIRNTDDAQIEAARNAITDRLSAIVIPGVGSKMMDQFDMVENIQNAVAHTHSPRGIFSYLKDFYPEMTMEAAKEIADIVKEIQKMEARYFEAKPYRGVGFEEVRLAVIPFDTDAEVVQQLERKGIPVRMYERGNEGQRRKLVEDASKVLAIRFRKMTSKDDSLIAVHNRAAGIPTKEGASETVDKAPVLVTPDMHRRALGTITLREQSDPNANDNFIQHYDIDGRPSEVYGIYDVEADVLSEPVSFGLDEFSFRAENWDELEQMYNEYKASHPNVRSWIDSEGGAQFRDINDALEFKRFVDTHARHKEPVKGVEQSTGIPFLRSEIGNTESASNFSQEHRKQVEFQQKGKPCSDTLEMLRRKMRVSRANSDNTPRILNKI